MPTNTTASEETSLQFLKEIQLSLQDSLISLRGRPGQSLSGHYIAHASNHIWRAVEGYLQLRETGRIDVSKLLIRPCLETVFLLLAVQGNPDFLSRIAWQETEQKKKFVRGTKRPDVDVAIATLEKQWEAIKQKFVSINPCIQFDEKKLDIIEVARTAGVETLYQSHYRLYSGYVHATFAATAGYLDEFEYYDN